MQCMMKNQLKSAPLQCVKLLTAAAAAAADDDDDDGGVQGVNGADVDGDTGT